MTSGIIADDLTGALDSGLQLFRKGLEVTVFFPGADLQFPEDLSGILVLDTESRNEGPDEAAERVKQAVSILKARRIPVIYKKVDSTLRGNPGAEIAAVLESCGFDAALLTPALPDTGRTVRNGTLFVNGVPVSDTGFSEDPRSPVKSSRIVEIIRRDIPVVCKEIGSSEINEAVREPVSFLENRLSGHEPCIFIADAENDDEMKNLSAFVAGCNGRVLPCGSAGLLKHLAELMTVNAAAATDRRMPPAGGKHSRGVGQAPSVPAVAEAPPTPAVAGAARGETGAMPVLVISSSMTSETRRQIDHVRDLEMAVRIKPEERALFAGGYTAAECCRQVKKLVAAGKHVIVDAGGKREELPVDRKKTAERSNMIQAFLAALTAEIFESPAAKAIGGLVVTGGETAITVSNALGAYGISIRGEVEPVVPSGVMLGGIANGLPVVTKAGGFGSDTVLAEAIAYLSRQ